MTVSTPVSAIDCQSTNPLDLLKYGTSHADITCRQNALQSLSFNQSKFIRCTRS